MARIQLNKNFKMKNLDFSSEKLAGRGGVTVVTLMSHAGFVAVKDGFSIERAC